MKRSSKDRSPSDPTFGGFIQWSVLVEASEMDTCTIIAIAGGSGSGKSVLSQQILNLLGQQNCSLIAQDSYYRDHSDEFDVDGGAVNFDHPEAIEFSLLAEHLSRLKAGEAIMVPNYDFVSHGRLAGGEPIKPSRVILLDGTLLLSRDELREHLDASVFIEVPEQVRLARRMKRDVEQRGRQEEGVLTQWSTQVQPMHARYVEDSATQATMVISGEDEVLANAHMVIHRFGLNTLMSE